MTSSRPRRVQDDAREVALARMLDLVPSERRIGSDATDEFGNPYELKTTTGQSLGTGRDVGVVFLNAMRSRYWVAARGKQTEYSFAFEEIYFLHPDDLSEWVIRIEERLAADLDVVRRAREAFAGAGASDQDLVRLTAIGNRGITLNNPKIPWQYVRLRGTRLGSTPALDLRKLVAERPLPRIT